MRVLFGLLFVVVQLIISGAPVNADSLPYPQTWVVLSHCVKQISDGGHCDQDEIVFSDESHQALSALRSFVKKNSKNLDGHIQFFGQRSIGSEQFVYIRLETNDY